ncbi:MAG: prepilin-type cleavage/methylation domain-containing protein [Planctomycetota bacterium]
MSHVHLGSRTRRGFTLLEALLSLAMSVVLMGLVSFAIRFYAVEMDRGDAEVRRLQLVTAVIQMIEDDLRSTLHPEPADTEALATLLASYGGGGSTGAAGDVLPPEDDGAGDLLLADDSVGVTDLSVGAAVLEKPGLIGNETQIQIDVSRLPRLEEYIPMVDGTVGDLEDVPSDIKTVAYYVQQAGTVGGVNDELTSIGEGETPADALAGSGGLVRRSLDRAATVYASTSGSIAQLNASGELLAPEVVGLQFEYWDGTLWQIQWSSDEMGELPLAIRVTVVVDDSLTDQAEDSIDSPTRTFQHVIRLPMANPVDETDESLSGVGL